MKPKSLPPRDALPEDFYFDNESDLHLLPELEYESEFPEIDKALITELRTAGL